MSDKTKYHSAMTTLTELLINEKFEVICSSNKSNKIVRLFDMCFSIFKNKKSVDYILVDTYSTQNFYYVLIVSQLARLLSIKYIPVLHGGNLPNRLNESPFFSNLIFSNSYKNVAPSKYLLDAFKNKGFDTVYIPNSIEMDKFPFKLRKKIKLKLLWVRAFHKTYNPTLAVRVVEILKNQYKDVTLCMVGPKKDSSLKEVKELAFALDLSENIVYTGVLPRNEWHKLSVNYDIFINTTNIDNMPVSVIEAMALGLPVVSTNVGGLPFLIEHNIDGILIEKNNARALADSVLYLINHPEDAQQIALNARKKAENFDSTKVVKQWREILD